MSKIKGNKIYVEDSDELASVIDKVVRHKEDKVFLCISDESYITQNVMNFRLIKREAESLGKDITIVSKNKRVRSLASMASLNVEEEAPVSYSDASSVEEDSNNTTANLASYPTRKKSDKQRISDIVVPTSKEKKEEEELKKRLEIDDMEENKPKEKVEVRERSSSKNMGNLRKTPARTFERLQKRKEEKEKRKNLIGDKKERFAPSRTPDSSFARKAKSGSGGAKKSSFRSINPKKLTIASVVLLLLAGLAYAGMFILPSAALTLTPQAVQDNMTFDVMADSNISSVNTEENIIPAQVMEERETDSFEFDATGSADVNEYATGTMTIYNESGNSQPLVETTRFVSSNGQLYRTTEYVAVPAGGTATVTVRADEPGEEYNIGPSTFSIPGLEGTPQYGSVYGQTHEDMEGGYVGTRTIVSNDDIENAEQEVENELLPRVGESLRDTRPDNLTIFEKTFVSEMEYIEIGAEPGDAVDSFTVDAAALARTFLISEQDMQELIEYHFLNFTDYADDYELSEEQRINYEIEDMDHSEGVVEFVLSVDQIFNHRVDTESIMENIVGQNEDEVKNILANTDGLEKSELRLWPFWVKSVPQDLEDISVEMEYVKGFDTNGNNDD